jgi:uncharacterized membrane protein
MTKQTVAVDCLKWNGKPAVLTTVIQVIASALTFRFEENNLMVRITQINSPVINTLSI